VPIEASSDADAVRGAGLVLFCVKSGDTESAGAAIAPHLERDALVLSLQNGVDNATRLRSLLSQRVISASSTRQPRWPGQAMSGTMAAAICSSNLLTVVRSARSLRTPA
jgi:ketopantoate reductase